MPPESRKNDRYNAGEAEARWTHQPPAMQDETLQTLAGARFNKMRMGVFPKHYIFNENEPLYPIFELGPDGKSDFDRPNVAAFRHFETQIGALRELGIEADIILFHPYDRWGYCALRESRTIAIFVTLWRGSQPIQMSGGRSPTNTTSSST